MTLPFGSRGDHCKPLGRVCTQLAQRHSIHSAYCCCSSPRYPACHWAFDEDQGPSLDTLDHSSRQHHHPAIDRMNYWAGHHHGYRAVVGHVSDWRNSSLTPACQRLAESRGWVAPSSGGFHSSGCRCLQMLFPTPRCTRPMGPSY